MLTILVLEDDMLLLKAIQDKLERNHFAVLLSRTFAQALEYMKDDNLKVNLIWLDHYLLGKETGLDFLAKIRAEEKWRVTPVFIVSNSTSPEMIQAYRSLGINKYYTKSDFRLEEIIGDIKEFFTTKPNV